MEKLAISELGNNDFFHSPIFQRAQDLPHIEFVVFAHKTTVKLLEFRHTTITILADDHRTKISTHYSVRVGTLVREYPLSCTCVI